MQPSMRVWGGLGYSSWDKEGFILDHDSHSRPTWDQLWGRDMAQEGEDKARQVTAIHLPQGRAKRPAVGDKGSNPWRFPNPVFELGTWVPEFESYLCHFNLSKLFRLSLPRFPICKMGMTHPRVVRIKWDNPYTLAVMIIVTGVLYKVRDGIKGSLSPCLMLTFCDNLKAKVFMTLDFY